MTRQLPELDDTEFNAIRALVSRLCGLNLSDGKRELVRSRLRRRMCELDCGSFQEYLERVRCDEDGSEVVRLLDDLSTNVTRFFREPDHFDDLRALVDRKLRAGTRRIRVWSAACSTGEEAYSIAITLCDLLDNCPAADAQILATDISTRALDKAREGAYAAEHIVDVDDSRRYFESNGAGGWRVNARVKKLVQFARLNLVEAWPMTGPFDAILCRNVMIYFERATQQQLISRIEKLLGPGGRLYIGHSESLTNLTHTLGYKGPTIYERPVSPE